MRKELFLKYLIYAAGLFALLVFVATKSESVMIWATKGSYAHGDLYRLAKVRTFKTTLPAPLEDEDKEPDATNLNGYDVFIVGDSFCQVSYGYHSFPRQLATALGRPVFHQKSEDDPSYYNPLYFFKDKQVAPGKKRLLIIESTERYLIDRFADPPDLDPDASGNGQEAPRRLAKLRSMVSDIEGRWFKDAEKNQEFFLKNSFLTEPVVELWNTALFKTIGTISDETPVYSINPPFLFYYEETKRDSETSFYYPHPDTLISQMADNIEALRNELLSRYDTELVFLPIPNKYTIYHRLVNNDPYDGFLPRLCAEIKARGVPAVNLYQPFMASSELLYFPADTHWTATGLNITLAETLKEVHQIESDPLRNNPEAK